MEIEGRQSGDLCEADSCSHLANANSLETSSTSDGSSLGSDQLHKSNDEQKNLDIALDVVPNVWSLSRSGISYRNVRGHQADDQHPAMATRDQSDGCEEAPELTAAETYGDTHLPRNVVLANGTQLEPYYEQQSKGRSGKKPVVRSVTDPTDKRSSTFFGRIKWQTSLKRVGKKIVDSQLRVTPPAEFSNLLQVRSNKLSLFQTKWTEYWCAIEGQCIGCYKTGSYSRPILSVPLVCGHVERCSTDKIGQYLFQVVPNKSVGTNGDVKPVVFRTDTEQEMERWVDAIGCHIKKVTEADADGLNADIVETRTTTAKRKLESFSGQCKTPVHHSGLLPSKSLPLQLLDDVYVSESRMTSSANLKSTSPSIHPILVGKKNKSQPDPPYYINPNDVVGPTKSQKNTEVPDYIQLSEDGCPDEMAYEGWLYKKTLSKSWSERYCRLTDGILSLYKNETETVPMTSKSVAGCHVDFVHTKNGRHVFRVEPMYGSGEQVLATTQTEDMTHWLHALKRAAAIQPTAMTLKQVPSQESNETTVGVENITSQISRQKSQLTHTSHVNEIGTSV
ncbi:uncharacterized protein LOC134182641 [Corticium candelabrum]|uniref:uncharacterized protein LOC134182641 n=1 Tax=Corticium candelabrum TaxID=121492 RepID=UPI002E270398|nr:uncharacterized protein LOC134182641 [Corticium candelabrum]